MNTSKYILLFSISALLFACGSMSKLDRSQAPAPAPAPTIQIPDYQNFTLDNGLQVIVVENHKLPSVSYQLTLDWDVAVEGDKAGYVSMAGDLMRKGTESKSKAEIDEEIDFIGASLNTYSSGMFGRSLSKHSDDLLTIMSDILLNASFPESEIEKAKTQTISGLASAKTEPNSMMSNVRGIVNYGKTHPYGEVTTEKTVEKINREDLVSFYNSYWKPNYSYLVIVGDITLDKAKSNAEKYFGSWKKGALPNPDYSKHQNSNGNKVVFVPLKGAVQSNISVTYPVDLTPGAPDALAANVMNTILGGGVFSGRLMQNLREDHGYTYGSRSSLSSDRIVGSFSAGASVRNEVTDSAVTEILYELRRMTTEPVTDSVLTFVKNSMSGSFARSLENPRTIARFALNTFRYNLPKDYYNTYLQRLSALTPEDVTTAAKKYIKPDNCNIIVVGNKDEADKLLKFSGDEKVWMLDQYGEEWKDMRPAPEGMTADDVISKFAEAVGGAEAISQITTLQQIGSMNMMGQDFPIDIKLQVGEKYHMTLGEAPMILADIIYNGENGVMAQMGQTQEMDDDMKANFKSESYPYPELNYKDMGYTMTLDGIGMLNDEEAYVMTITDEEGSPTTEYYSVSTGLKLKDEKMESHPMAGDYMSSTTYESYIEVEGMKFPGVMLQSEGPQQMKISTTEVRVNPTFDSKEFDLK